MRWALKETTQQMSLGLAIYMSEKKIVMRNRWLAASVINESCKIFQGKTRR
jgi:hypothetical protein